jgi:hypothetical protein
MALNEENTVLALDARGGILQSFHFQTWQNGQRTDAGPATYPSGYGYTGAIHGRNFDNSGRIAMDIYNLATEDFPTALGLQDVRQGTTVRLPDLPAGAFMDGSLPVISSGGNYITARSDDVTRGWRLDLSSNTWQELIAPGSYIQPDAVNTSGTVAGRMGGPNGGTVPFFATLTGGVQQITNNGTEIFGEAIALSDTGLITGQSGGRAFYFNANTLEFRFISDPIGLWSNDVNNAGAIIGATYFGGNILGIPTDTAFYWDAEAGLLGLDDLIGDQVNDWFILDAWDINDNGWILGNGFRRSDNTGHYVLLRPVPEPGGFELAFGGQCGNAWPPPKTMNSHYRQINLNGQGIRSIQWCPQLNGGAGAYLIIGGAANGGPLKNETSRQVFSLYRWDNVNVQPVRVVADLAPYAVRPEGVNVITLNNVPRVIFVEDRFKAEGYDTQNAVHWPLADLNLQ